MQNLKEQSKGYGQNSLFTLFFPPQALNPLIRQISIRLGHNLTDSEQAKKLSLLAQDLAHGEIPNIIHLVKYYLGIDL